MTPQKIADMVVSTFDGKRVMTVEQAVIRGFQLQGLTEAEAIDRAPDKIVSAVLRCLQAYQQDKTKSLPFYISDNNSNKLIGKARQRRSDTEATAQLRSSLHLEDDLHDAVYRLGDCNFERLVARLMLLAGASEANAGCTNDDGGIDVWGRIPLLCKRPDVPSGILPFTIIDTPLLFLGQCKCYAPNVQHGPEVIRSFASAVRSCIGKYANNNLPPNNRVPDAYYRLGESVLSLFFSTATFSDKAEAQAYSEHIYLVDGRKIARYLLLHQVGISQGIASPYVDAAALEAWAAVTNPM